MPVPIPRVVGTSEMGVDWMGLLVYGGACNSDASGLHA